MAAAPVCLADLWDVDEPALKLATRGLVVPSMPSATGDGLAMLAPGVEEKFDRACAFVERWGVHVIYLDGYRTRGRQSEADYGGALDHHTGGPAWATPEQEWSITMLCRDGRSDLNGPLSQTVTWADGTLVIVAMGTSNHAGGGGWAGLSGNWSVLGNEAVHSGGPNQPWPEAQLRTSLLWKAACAISFDFPASKTCEHKEWSDAGKIDRIIVDGEERRRALADLIAAGGPGPSLPYSLAALAAAIS